MRRTDRLFQLIQLLRAARRPMTGCALAEALEVSLRTLYRDVATLQSMRVPIAGEAGVGYVMRRGYDLPPLMFSRAEIEALLVGIALLRRTADRGLKSAAASALRKIAEVMPRELAADEGPPLYVSAWEPEVPPGIDLRLVRRAIGEERKLLLRYRDRDGARSRRRIRPLAMVYYADSLVVAAWCELRRDFRHFRADRMDSCVLLASRFAGEGDALRRAWLSAHPDLAL
jgi:predicted DNA-binding transcriptional regulator YafY